MIRTFGSKETERIFNLELSTKLPRDIQQNALRKLRMLDNAKNVTDLRAPPGNHLERLSGNWDGFWSIRINDQWRVCFQWIDNDAYEVEIVDYH